MSIVVSWVTSPCKSIVLPQLLIFSFLFSQRNKKNVSTAEREAKEEEERGIVALAWAVGVVAMPIMSP